MPNNQQALIRYQTLDRCFSNRGKIFYIEDLVDACNDALQEMGYHGVKRRQVLADIAFMESNPEWNISLIEKEYSTIGKRRFYRYKKSTDSIWNKELTTEELQQLQDTVAMLSRFEGMPHFEWMKDLLLKLETKFHLNNQTESVICFEQNIDYTGREHITPLFNAILAKQSLAISYRMFNSEEDSIVYLSPYFLKEYNNRWYLIGYREEYNRIEHLALDRIARISPSTREFVTRPTYLNAEDYFSDVVGVTILANSQIEEIVLQFSSNRYPYVKTKPIHQTQHNDDTNRIVKLQVRPNNELISMILSFGADVEVLAPEHIRTQVKGIVDMMQRKY